MELKETEKVTFSLKDKKCEKKAKRVKANTQIFFTASMMTSKTARVRSSSVLRQSILDSIERNIVGKIGLHQVNYNY